MILLRWRDLSAPLEYLVLISQVFGYGGEESSSGTFVLVQPIDQFVVFQLECYLLDTIEIKHVAFSRVTNF
jgi:hypothetical protein